MSRKKFYSSWTATSLVLKVNENLNIESYCNYIFKSNNKFELKG